MSARVPEPVAPALHVYSRHGCHLCDVLIEALLPLVRGRLSIEVHDIDSRDEWRERYDQRVPVVEFQGRLVCQYRLDRPAIEDILAQFGAPGNGQ
jgi:hypothetical protein